MIKRLFFLFLLLCMPLLGKDTYLYMRGFLGGDLISAVTETFEEGRDAERIILHVDSSSGEIREVLSLAQKIYDIQMRENKYVVVYVQGKAVGPAAIFPFIADELITTPLVAWGDIPYGSKGEMTAREMSIAVKQLINRSRRIAPTLEKLADAMVDPHYQLVYRGDTGEIEKDREVHFDPLVLNLKGIQSLGLSHTVMSDEAFAQTFLSEEVQVSQTILREPQDDLDRAFRKYIKYDEAGQNNIGYLHIGNERPIDQSTYIYVRFALKDFVEKGVRFVVLDLNTPGGEVLSALKISNLLQKVDIEHKIPVVAFVHDWAVSAGAMLAYSCRFIGVEPNSIMGAAEPVIFQEGGKMVTASEKVNSALRAQFGTLASFYGRNPFIAEAMVDKDLILVIRDHEVIRLDDLDEVRASGPHPDKIISGRGKLLTLTGEQMMDLGVANFMVPITPVGMITDAEWKQGMWPAHKSLIFQEPYFAQIPHAVMIDYQDWRVGFFSILSHPVIASLLFIGLVIGLYIEINTPGFGVPGSIALGCLVLILLSSFASHVVNWIELIILCVGMILLALELFVIPGFGIVGILGIILTIIGLFALMLPGIGQLSLVNPATFRLVGEAFIERLAWLCGGLIFAIIVIVLLAHFFSDRYFRFSKLILKGEQEGYKAGMAREVMPEEGEVGEAVTPLRPSGKVHIGENLFDAMSQGEFLEKHTSVEVVKIEGSKVIVKPIREYKDFT
ncbi:MAG: serine protease [Chlamydiia bacterium]|nr:serine protease [Chlamydiia bacterium]